MLKIKPFYTLFICHLTYSFAFPQPIRLISFIPCSYAAENTHASEKPKEEFERGPHNGRLLKKNDFSVEITIYETNTPPQFRVYVYDKNTPLNPSEVKLNISLKRIDGEVNHFEFKPAKEYLDSNSTVIEPHSFDVEVKAQYKGTDYQWSFPSYEGRVKISPEAAKNADMKIEIAGPGQISEFAKLTGQVVLNANKTVDVRARFPGIVKEIYANTGESVKKDQSLIKVESNGTLEFYNIKAPQDGIIITRNTNIGDLTLEKPLLTISDLSTIWAKFHAFPQDISKMKAGNSVTVQTLDGKQSTQATINFLSPVVDPTTQSTFAVSELVNNDNIWKAGTIIKGNVLVAKDDVPLVVKATALQKFRDFTVVFAQFGDVYEVRMLELGRSDGEWVEVLSGIKPGTKYVTQNSYVIKADLEKDGATHDH